MKTFKPKNTKAITDVISYFNFCHDACLKKISFIKQRDVDKKNGCLIYPFQNVEDFVNCDIEVDLILNSYQDAKKDQMVRLEFKDAKAFTFSQHNTFDYSNIYELEFESKEDNYLSFSFSSTKDKIKCLSIMCKEFVCKEK